MTRVRSTSVWKRVYRASSLVVVGIPIVATNLPRLEAAAPPQPYRLIGRPSTLGSQVRDAARSSTRFRTRSGRRCWNYKAPERGFARRMNGARVRLDRSKLRLDPQLSKVARVHTRDMVKRDLLYHTAADQLKRRVRRWVVLGENVGVGVEVDTLHTAFMGSPAHRANIVFSKFRYVGVGVRNADSRMWVTVIFEARLNPGTPLPMPSC
jgi:uncharacterized protein YkwD